MFMAVRKIMVPNPDICQESSNTEEQVIAMVEEYSEGNAANLGECLYRISVSPLPLS